MSDKALCRAVQEMENRLFEADLGGGLFKKRVARIGKGKSSGFRTLVATNKGDRWFFVFGFAKNETGNINKTKEKALKKLAEQYLSYTTAAIEKIKKTGEIIELSCHEKNEINDT